MKPNTRKQVFINKKNGMRTISALLVAVLSISFAAPCFAASDTVTDNKEEVVYVNLNADGATKGIYVVNILKGTGEIQDYGNYSSIRNMTTTDELTLNNGVVTGENTSDKLYYEGTLDNAEIPWDISISYFIDGTEYTAEELAGKNGAFELKMTIRQNEDYDGEFFDNYALQVSATMDTGICSNIIADDATIANVGSDKQLTYTILPGSEKDISVTADVIDFHMDRISINGVRLNLSIEIEDEELRDQVNDLIDGIGKIDDGAGELNNGMSDLKSSVKDELLSGITTLQNGSGSLDTGISSLQKGIKEAQTGLNSLNSNSDALTNGSSQVNAALLEIQSSLSAVSVKADQLSELTTASSQIKTGIDDLYSGVSALQSNIGYAQYKAAMAANGLDIDSLISGNTQAISGLNATISNLQATITALPSNDPQIAVLQAQIDQLYSVIALLDGNNAAIGGTESYLSQLSDTIDTLYAGVGELKIKYDSFDEAICDLADTLAELLVNVSALSNGIDQLVTQYDYLDSGIKEYTEGVATLVTGYSQIVEGISSLSSGSKELSNGIRSLHSGTNDLYDGITELYDGTVELSDGTSELKDETDGIDTEISEKMDTLLDSVTGGNGEVVSFVSEKNTSVKSVQFVIQTEPIELSEKKVEVVNTEDNLSFWQKLLQLFGVQI